MRAEVPGPTILCIKERLSLALKRGFRLFGPNRWSMVYVAAALMGLSACSAVKPISTVDDPVGRLIEIATHDDLFDNREVQRALGETLVPEPNPGGFPGFVLKAAAATRLAQSDLSYTVAKPSDDRSTHFALLSFQNLGAINCYNRKFLARRLAGLLPPANTAAVNADVWTVFKGHNRFTYIYLVPKLLASDSRGLPDAVAI